ncbi:PAAR domain-containing protein, partial [Pseudomonas vancouverensis]
RVLFLSPPSLVHRWTEAGGVGQMPGYATHLDGVARASKYVKYGGWVGTTVGGGASAMKVQEVCRAGNTEACERIRFTETGSFAGGIFGGVVAGSLLTTTAVGGLCVGLGAATLGTGLLTCSVIAVGLGSIGGSMLGEAGGEIIGEVVYENLK